jgi:hypothetical protein
VVDDESVDATLTEDSAEDTGSVDWQKRYTDTQAEYTKNQQALADERKVWEDEQALLARVQEKFPHLLAEGKRKPKTKPTSRTPRPTRRSSRPARNSMSSRRGGSRSTRNAASRCTSSISPRSSGTVRSRRRPRPGSRTGPSLSALTVRRSSRRSRSSTRSPLSWGPRRSRGRRPLTSPGGQPGTGVKDWSQMSREEIDDVDGRARAGSRSTVVLSGRLRFPTSERK